MEFKTTFSSKGLRKHARRAGFTLAEFVIGSGVASIVIIVIASLSLFSSRHFAFLADQLSLQSKSLQMSEQFSRDAREARRVVVATANRLTLDKGANGTVTYDYVAPSKLVTRQENSGALKTMLTDVQQVTFSTFQRTPRRGEFQPFASTSTNEIKVIYCKWTCSRTNAGRPSDAVQESQTAKAVLRIP